MPNPLLRPPASLPSFRTFALPCAFALKTPALADVTRTASITAGTDGRWRVDLPSLAASATSATLSLVGKTTVTLTDIPVGEV